MKKPKFNNRLNEKIESKDGREFWISRSVACVSTVFAFLNDEFTENSCYVLGVKRGTAMDEAGKFCLPCGYLDWDETGGEGAKREIWEETGLSIDSLLHSKNKTLSFFTDPWKVVTDPTLDAKQNISLYYGGVYSFKKALPHLTSKNADKNEVELLEWIPILEVKNKEWAFNHEERIYQFQEYCVSRLV